jgi:hypothetical protein
MTMIRKLGLLLAAAALVVFVVSVYFMSQRAAAFNRAADHPEYQMLPQTAREFKLYGRDVSIQDAAMETGEAALWVSFGDAELLIPVRPPPVRDAPDLGLYEEWVAVLETWRIRREEARGDPERVPGSGRLIIVNRRTPEGFDPETWGQVRRTDWTFDFYELTPEGDFEHWVKRWPRSKYGDSVARREPESELAKIEPLEERSYEFLAALHVIPKLALPKHKFKDTAVEAMGWTLPAAAFSGLAIGVGLFLAVKPSRLARRDEST